ncbi:MAG: KamA family radical SAM protein, partial [Spirochaetaceae bacterium]|nr:KamA family radical SAM protein [Spirochaetaceae bacterium]
MRWKQELKEKIKSRAALEKLIVLAPHEKEWFAAAEAPAGKKTAPPRFGFQVTPSYLALAGKAKNDPLRRQCVPSAQEFRLRDGELSDPLGDAAHTKSPRLIHHYPDRALLLVTDECAMACRYCFRRYYTGRGAGPIRGEELRGVAAYLAAHPEIRELVLSGGDPLTLEDEQLFALIARLRKARPGLILRLSTRVPVALPSRVTKSLARGLSLRQPLWGVIHINHPRELGLACGEALRRLAAAGVPLLSQTVLLRGVNDSEDVLEELFRGLIARRVKPYYLFQADLAEGTG